MQVQSLGGEDPLEEGMATHPSILTWRIPRAEEPGGLQSRGLQRVGHDWNDLACHTSETNHWSPARIWAGQTAVESLPWLQDFHQGWVTWINSSFGIPGWCHRSTLLNPAFYHSMMLSTLISPELVSIITRMQGYPCIYCLLEVSLVSGAVKILYLVCFHLGLLSPNQGWFSQLWVIAEVFSAVSAVEENWHQNSGHLYITSY